MKNKIIVTAFILVALIAFSYVYYFSINDKKTAISVLNNAGITQGYEPNAFTTLDENFLIAWARALRLLNTKFMFKGMYYNTRTGTATT